MFVLDIDDTVEDVPVEPGVLEMKKFISIVAEYFNSISSGDSATVGISAFRVVCDETNNTPDMIDQGQLIVDVYVPAYWLSVDNWS